MSENKVLVNIDGASYEVEAGLSILSACRAAGIKVPTLCFLDGVSEEASCSVCVVEVKGARTLIRSCVTPVTLNMQIQTNTERVRLARRTNLELLLAGHPEDCFYCDRNQTCELRKIAHDMGVREARYPKAVTRVLPIDTSSPSLIRDPSKCILCRRCISVCDKVQSVHAIESVGRGKSSRVSTFMDMGLGKVACINCGQCLLVCPTGAIIEQSAIDDVWRALSDPKKFVMVETAPAVRAALGEEFGLPAGTRVTGKMAAALRKLGFGKIFDTQFSADLTIIEEGHELIERLVHGGKLPMITSCSPGWIKFAEHFYPELLGHVSSCKSPQQMFGAIAKTYYAEKCNIDPRDMVVVSVMPCIAKKFEARRPEMKGAYHYWKEKKNYTDADTFFDVDYVLTTRELGRMIQEAGIDFVRLEDASFDEPLGVSTGAAVIFGATGGVMEAALRTAYEVLTGETLSKVDFNELRGLDGIKTATVDIKGKPVRVAVASSLAKARVLLEEVKAGKSPYAFIEIMTCPGGCLGGGGQPMPTNNEVRLKRMAAIYEEDEHMALRKSHDNPAIKQLYSDFLKKPLGSLSEELLHTHYAARPMLSD
jgi:NADH-quinone oxidoreductase subunit G